MKMELVPPGCHLRNAAEVVIRNFKAHFLSVLTGTAEIFPPYLWDRLLPKAEVTVNLLRHSNTAPHVSAYSHLSGPFDYNKTPLVPMGCEVQVHEKTDKRGTWEYHSVNIWYLATSPEYYHTHLCHIKTTNIDRFTNTTQFNHRNITKPTITHADKIMSAIADYDKAIRNMGNNKGAYEMQQLLQLTEKSVRNNESIITPPKPAPHTNVEQLDGIAHSLPRMNKIQPLGDTDIRMTRKMTKDTPLVPRVSPTEVLRVERTPKMVQDDLPLNHQIITRNKIRRRRQAQARPTVSDSAPAHNTRSQTRAEDPASSRTRTSTRASKRLSQLMRTTPAKSNKMTRKEHATAIEEHLNRKQLRQMTRRISNLESEVHQAMVVMDKETGRMLNYKQLMLYPKYKKYWITLSANEFGRLANGVGGRIKNTTNTINFIRKKDVPISRRKDVTYGSFVCNVRNEKTEKNRTRFVIGGDRINYPG